MRADHDELITQGGIRSRQERHDVRDPCGTRPNPDPYHDVGAVPRGFAHRACRGPGYSDDGSAQERSGLPVHFGQVRSLREQDERGARSRRVAMVPLK